MLCGRSERVASIIAELCEEREDVIIPCPPGASSTGGRRKSAPSPGSSSGPMPSSDPTTTQAGDFRAWVQANTAAGTLPGAAQLPGAALYVQRMPFYAHNSVPHPPAAGPSEYGQGSYRNQNRGYRSLPAYHQQQQMSFQGRGYNPRHSSQRQSNYRHNLHPSHQPPTSITNSRTTTLSRRLSWDGSAGASPKPVEPAPMLPTYQPTYNYTSIRPSQTAPTSPTMGPAPFVSPRSGHSSGSAARSQSHSSAERRQMPLPPFQPVPRPLEAISFGNFNSSMINIMDTALARAEDRRRRGMQSVDDDHESISFGDVRVFRKSRCVVCFAIECICSCFLGSNPSRSSSPLSAEGEAIPAPPRKGTILPQVLEAIEVNRPNSKYIQS